MAIELATAYVSVVPSVRGLQGELQRQLLAPAAAAGARAGRGVGGGMASGVRRGMTGVSGFMLEAGRRSGTAFASGFKTTVVGLAGVLEKGTLGAVALGGAISGFGIKASADIEQTRTAFTSLLGSEKAATDQLAQLQKFAAATPFSQQDVFNYAQQYFALANSIGLAKDQVQPFLTTIGNIAAVTGASTENIHNAVMAIGQIGSSGRVTLDNLNQISEAFPGFNGAAAIAAATGQKTADVMKEISAGTLDAKTGVQALLLGMQQFPGAANAMVKQSQTLKGVWSTFTDTIRISLTNAFQPIIPTIKNLLTSLVPVVTDTLKTLAPAIQQFMTGLAPMIGPLLQGLGTAMTAVFQALGPVIAALAPVIQPLANAFAGLVRAVQPLLTLFAQVVAQLGPPLLSLFQQVLNVLSPVITALATSFVPALQQIVQALGPALAPLAQAFAQIAIAAAPVVTLLAQTLAPVIGPLANAVAQLATAFIPLINALVQSLGPVLPALASALTQIATAFVPVVSALVTALAPVLPTLAKAFADLLTAIAPIAGTIGRALVSVIQAIAPILPTIAQAAAAMAEALAKVITQLQPLINLLGRLLTIPIVSFFTHAADALDHVSGAVKNFGLGLGNPISLLPGLTHAFDDLTRTSGSFDLGKVIANLNGVGATAHQSAREILNAAIASLNARLALSNMGIGAKLSASEIADTIGTIAQLIAAQNAATGSTNALTTAQQLLAQATSAANAAAAVGAGIDASIGAVAPSVPSAPSAPSFTPPKVSVPTVSAPKATPPPFDKSTLTAFLNQATGHQENPLTSALNAIFAAARAAGQKLSSGLVDQLRSQNKRLIGLTNERDRIAKQLEKAQQHLSDLLQARSQEARTIKDAVTGTFNLGSLEKPQFGEPFTLSGIMRQLSQTVRNAHSFNAILRKLAKEGLNKALLQQLAEAGPAALPQARALLTATPKQIRTINSEFRDLTRTGASTGKFVAGQMYDSAIEGTRGLIRGLQHSESAVNRAIRHLAEQMIKELRRALHMHSPSKRLFDEAALAFEGYRLGIESKHAAIAAQARRIADGSVPRSQQQVWAAAQGHRSRDEEGRQVINLTQIIHNPIPEPASRTTPASLRRAATALGKA